MTVLSKSFSREGSLVYCQTWQQSNQEDQAAWIGWNYENLLFLYEPPAVKISVWYNLSEMRRGDVSVTQRLAEEPTFLDRVHAAFFEYLDVLAPYARREKTLGGSLEELQEYLRHWRLWWLPMAILFVLPNIAEAPREAKECALKTRAETEWFDGDPALMSTMQQLHPAARNLVGWMTISELVRLADGGMESVDVAAIEARRKGFVFFNGDLCPLTGLEPTLTRHNVVLNRPKIPANVNQCTGTAAAPGQAWGCARIIRRTADIPLLQPGEILVTEMTHPEYLPAMRIAAGIVTDEGGLTSHAAILSRELKKPCVVGTKIATEVLKDGDLVEVDAEKGIVRILKRG